MCGRQFKKFSGADEFAHGGGSAVHDVDSLGDYAESNERKPILQEERTHGIVQ